MTQSNIHDVVIIGAGPAGLAAALYTTRDRYDTLILEKSGLPGGQIMLTERVENYPGYELISGADLITQMVKQVEKLGASVATDQEVTLLQQRENGMIEVTVNDGEAVHLARVVILAPGSDYRRLGIPGEDEMRQATRVSYCATCDGAFYRGKHVLAIGGGNTAVEDAIYLAERFANRVTLIHRRDVFRAQQVLVDELHAKARKHNMDIHMSTQLEQIVGNADKSEISHVVLRNLKTNQLENLRVDGVFIFVGVVPSTKWLRGFVELTDEGYIRCNCLTLQTSVPGVFVAGDCRVNSPMQLATATADGVLAAMMMKQYLRNPAAWTSASPGQLSGGGW